MKKFSLAILLLLVLVPLLAIAEDLSLLQNFESSLHESFGFGKIPVIYFLLILLGITSFFVWLYSLLTLKLADMMPESFVQEIRRILNQKRYEKVMMRCSHDKTFAASIISRGIEVRKKGPQFMIEAMQNEGLRCQNSLLEKVKLLNRISLAAPFLGLFGTLLSFYFSAADFLEPTGVTHSLLTALSVCLGPTALGIIISLFSTIFYATLKNRIIFLLNAIISETLTLVRTVDIDYF